MIVQPLDGREDALVILQSEHTKLAGAFAEAWGNDRFAPLFPRGPMLDLVAHHDDGWDQIDASIGRDPSTGLPWNLVKTPIPELVKSSKRSPELAAKIHPWASLLSSMHTHGLFHGRYGLSDKIFVKMIPAEHQPAVADMIAGEEARRADLRTKLAADPETAAWVEEQALFRSYKHLQFFDTLALYFNCTADPARGRATFPSVPEGPGREVTITVERVAASEYSVDPWPFAGDRLVVTVDGKRVAPQPEGTSMPVAIAAAPIERETITLRPSAARTTEEPS
jgi:hypothetical protein